MTEENILEVVKKYKRKLHKFDASKCRHSTTTKLRSLIKGNAHLRWMCDQIEIFIAQGRKEKAFRWLGFMQGFFWRGRDYTLSQLGNHNRPRKQVSRHRPRSKKKKFS